MVKENYIFKMEKNIMVSLLFLFKLKILTNYNIIQGDFKGKNNI